jgi:hypothetical protein
MGGTLTYDKVQHGKSENERMLAGGGEFPICNGFYPDCPEKPSLLDSKCRNCPKTEGVVKPKLEWVVCEHCEDEGVPIDSQTKIDQNEETKCHICDKINSKEYIAKLRQ